MAGEDRLARSTIFFILGGPGAGKGTLCSGLTKSLPRFRHFSAGDLLRAEQGTGSEFAKLIEHHIVNGTLVPVEITIALLKNAMLASPEEVNVFLIDGFPRACDQADVFENNIKPGKSCIYLTCSEEIMKDRILGRGEGRIDDNIDSLIKRFNVFNDTTIPVIERFRSTGRVLEVDGSRTPAEILEQVLALIESHI